MKRVVSALLTLSALLLMTSMSFARTSPPLAATVAGVYENFTIGKGSGDLEGMLVAIISAGGGYYAIVQIAQGGAEDPKPELVPAEVKGKTVTFAVGDEKYSGTASPNGLALKPASGETRMLKRKACRCYFKSLFQRPAPLL